MKYPAALPKISHPLLRFFSRYSASYLARHFHAVRLLENGTPPNESVGPLIVYLNHAAWWDPLVCLFLARKFFVDRTAYAPMDAAALGRYGFLKRLGFFPVKTGTTRGAAEFLRTSAAILENPKNTLFLTPQGKFADVRAPLVFAAGLEHLAARAPAARYLPLAIEYTFWEERKPEVLLAFGEAGTGDLRERLSRTQARLAAAAQRRVPNEWQVLLRAKSGVNRPYDLWRKARARLRGEPFEPGHSQL
ncbi:MAG: lysophospholipid acyltransferase family protein [Chthoniobacterales bacterium]